jgi:hypothetical protein
VPNRFTLEIPWQPSKFRAENRVRGLGRAGSAIAWLSGFSSREARREA